MVQPEIPQPKQLFTGRGATTSPPNRFEAVHSQIDYEQLAADDELLAEERKVKTVFLPDHSKTLIRENDSPDVPFRYSINPYRGCEHGCVYCYARPTHETLGMNAGLDFESKILVKHDAVELLRKELNHPKWQPEPITISGVTDCYQPAERRIKLTRGILEVMLEARQPVTLITKNALLVRDIDILAPLAQRNLVAAALSITTLDADLARTMEPRTATPPAKLRAIRELSAAGVPVRVMIAPLIPGLNDHELPHIMEAVQEAGANGAGYVMLRLPLAVSPMFLDWLRTHRPLQAEKVEGLVRSVRGGKLYVTNWVERMRGDGPYADGIAASFDLFAKKFSLNKPWTQLDCSQFMPPKLPGGQMRLFS